MILVQDLEAQQEATANFKAFGYDKSGIGVSDAEWRLNRGLLKVCCALRVFYWPASQRRAVVDLQGGRGLDTAAATASTPGTASQLVRFLAASQGSSFALCFVWHVV